jgi:hypothetical protein
MRLAILALLFVLCARAQNIQRWVATTGDVVLSGAGTTATIQQPAINGSDIAIDQIVVYCSVVCTVSQAANGAAATTTAGTVTPILPAQLNTPAPVNFFTASNVGTGTAQAGILHIGAGSTYVLCLSKACGTSSDVILGHGGGTASNYSVAIASLTGTVNITYYLRNLQ